MFVDKAPLLEYRLSAKVLVVIVLIVPVSGIDTNLNNWLVGEGDNYV
jgi:hypothetical protein